MKERPMLMSSPMVRAILAGKKTQTRRVVKGVKHFPEWGNGMGLVGGVWRYGSPAGLGLSDRGDRWSVTLDEDHQRRMCTGEAYGWGAGAGCPYGQPGDRLWVREAWAYHPDYPESARRALHRADRGVEHDVERWRPSIHMPRWASRITLEITRVRVERLQDIGEADAVAEGVAPQPTCRPDDDTAAFSRIGRVHGDSFPIARYAALWEHINGPGSWAANPWVWVVEFKRLEGGAA